MKIALACHSEDWAGAESSLFALLRRLDPARHDPLAVLPTNGVFADRLERLGVRTAYASIVPWTDQRGAGILDRFGSDLEWRVEALSERLDREDVDLVMTNSAVMLEGALAAHRVGVPHVWRIHEMLSRHDNLERALDPRVYPAALSALADRVLVVSEAVKADLGESRAEVVPNGVEPYEASPQSRGARVGIEASIPMVVFVGTLSEAKGVPLLAPIMKRVRARVPDARCVLVGRDVGARKPLEREVRKSGLASAFTFLGFQDDAMGVIAHADALVLPTRVDSLPCVVMEAMAAGVPAVSTHSGGASELIVHGETGYLADVDDAPALADALIRLLGDRDHARALGATAQRRARTVYSMERMHAAFAAAFDALAGERRAPEPTASRALVQQIVKASGARPAAAATERVLASLGDLRRQSAAT